MTDNIESAAEVIGRYVHPDFAEDAAKSLAAEGLLAPDPVEPTDRSVPEWESPTNDHHAVSVSDYGTVRIWGDTSGYTPQEAREIAHRLLSAATYAEKNTHTEEKP